MTKTLKLLALFLALVTVISAFAACGAGVDTTADSNVTETPETDAPETDAPETEAPETDAPETEAPETEAPETEAPETEAPINAVEMIDGVFSSVTFDFETDLSVADYINSFDGFEINSALRGGIIKDGRWNYNAKCFAVSDNLGIFLLDKYSVEFDFCFNAYVTTTNPASVFSSITDDDGTLNDKSSFYIPFRTLPDGSAFHDHAKTSTYHLELGKTHHYKAVFDRIEESVSVYFDDELLCVAKYSQTINDYNCFRFMDNNKGADMWIDNIVIKNLANVAE